VARSEMTATGYGAHRAPRYFSAAVPKAPDYRAPSRAPNLSRETSTQACIRVITKFYSMNYAKLTPDRLANRISSTT